MQPSGTPEMSGKAFLRDDAGATTIEFVILFSFLITIVFSVFEAGFLMTRFMMLDRGVDVAVRSVRLGVEAPTQTGLREDICDVAGVFRDCERNLVVEFAELDSASSFPRDQATCVDRSDYTIDYSSEVQNLPADTIVFVRACIVVDPIIPGLGLGLGLPKDETGGFRMVSYAAYKTEP